MFRPSLRGFRTVAAIDHCRWSRHRPGADPVLGLLVQRPGDSDYVVGQVWARVGSAYLLPDQVGARLDCPTTVRAVRQLSAKWPYTLAKLIEDKANGSVVIQMIAHEIAGILPVNPEGDKVARAAAVSPLI